MYLKTRTKARIPNRADFFDHYEELRSRLIKAIAAFLFFSCLFYAVIDEALGILAKPVGILIFTTPAEAFVTRIMLTLFGGFFLALPVILYQIWRFIASGLKEHELRYVRIFGPCSLLLFLSGALFAYFVIVPVSVRFLLGYANEFIVPMITIKNYVSFVGTMLLAFGIVFELPLALMFLAKIGVATPAFLIQKRKYAIVIILIISAVITPPDVITQIMMALPLVALYEVGIIASKCVYRN